VKYLLERAEVARLVVVVCQPVRPLIRLAGCSFLRALEASIEPLDRPRNRPLTVVDAQRPAIKNAVSNQPK